MTVADVFAIPGLGTVAAGRIELGRVTQYDQVWLRGGDGAVKTGVAFIHAGGKGVKTAGPGDTVGLVLRGMAVDRVHVGTVVSGSRP
jgi:elongation factor Tu